MRSPLVIYGFATAPLWISLYTRKILFSFLSVKEENAALFKEGGERRKGFFKGGFFWVFLFFMYDIQQCFICRSSDSTVSEDAGIEPKTVATIRHWLLDALTNRLDLIPQRSKGYSCQRRTHLHYQYLTLCVTWRELDSGRIFGAGV